MINIVLDLDETLIHTERITPYYSDELDKTSDFSFKIDNQYYWVIKRPGLDLFLDFLFKYFTVGIWTAGDKEYAKQICKNILTYPQLKKIRFIYSRNFCHLEDSPPAFTKPLAKIFQLYPDFSKHNTIMIDNNLNVMRYNMDLGVNIPDFTNQYNDGMLYHIRNIMIKYYQRNDLKSPGYHLARELNNYINTIT